MTFYETVKIDFLRSRHLSVLDDLLIRFKGVIIGVWYVIFDSPESDGCPAAGDEKAVPGDDHAREGAAFEGDLSIRGVQNAGQAASSHLCDADIALACDNYIICRRPPGR